MASCGTSAQYSQQSFQDGIYYRPFDEPEPVALLSEEDFRLKAAQQIELKRQEEAMDSIKVTYRDVYPGDFEYDMYFSLFPLIAVGNWSLAFNNWYWDRWHLWWGPYGPVGNFNSWWVRSHWDFWGPGRWYNPWYGFGWYDPWYGPGWHNHWYGPGWYDPWYGPGRGPGHPGGGGFRRNVSYGPRYQTQGGSRAVTPGSGSSVRRSPASSYSGGRGSGSYYRGTRSVTPGTSGHISPSETRGSSSGTYRRSVGGSSGRSSGSTYSRSSSGNSSSGSVSRSSGSSTRSSSSSSSSYSRSSSSSGSSYSGGGSRSGGFSGGGSSSSHSGGGGGSRGGGGRR